MEYILRTVGVSKRYGSNWVLKNVNMNIQRGDIYGFVGENGSGKTTIIRLITGLIYPNEGHLELFGASSDSPEINVARKKLAARFNDDACALAADNGNALLKSLSTNERFDVCLLFDLKRDARNVGKRLCFCLVLSAFAGEDGL